MDSNYQDAYQPKTIKKWTNALINLIIHQVKAYKFNIIIKISIIQVLQDRTIIMIYYLSFNQIYFTLSNHLRKKIS